jgi:pyrroloquinoline quinone (PQQ) biosynthesis protein C
MKHAFDTLLQDFRAAMAIVQASRPMQRMLAGRITPQHYAEVLRQIYYQTRENPQIQACATAWFRGHQRAAVAPFLKHAAQEIGHDQLALADLQAMGLDTAELPRRQPLPTTTAVTAFAYYQIQHLNPVGYLGYLFFLEFMPTSSGGAYVELFRRAGVPDSAFGFIREHQTVDVAHNRLMQRYVADLVTTEADLESVRYALATTAQLYTAMIEGAFEQADRERAWGCAPAEAARLEPQPA